MREPNMEDVFKKRFNVEANEEPDRAPSIHVLKEKYGEFSASIRPHFKTGSEVVQREEEVFHLLPSSVHIFASASAEYNWADVDTLGRRGIWYANGAGASNEAVSDTALFMILSVFRNFWRSQRATRTCDPEEFLAMHQLVGSISRGPRDHVLGIVGLGNISRKLAYKARTALRMKIHCYDILRSPPEIEEELQATFTLHCMKYLRYLLNKEAFAAMKPGARLANTAWGQVVNEEALIEALQNGKLLAAALDVHYHEPQVVTVSKEDKDEEKRELFWALAGGGGGNFGVTVSLTSGMHELRDQEGYFVCGQLRWHLPQQKDAFKKMMNVFNTTKCPPELTIDALWTHDKNKQLIGGMTVIYNG
ncbi:2-ketogluconate reductase [Colletotrichum incanum]|nr:2-ketogluconate reductase [Colletotrichum incanum]